MSSFFLSNISLDATQNSDLNVATRIANGAGNFFLSPVRHLFHGRSITVVAVPTSIKDYQLMLHVDDSTPKGMERFFKTIVSIALIVPGIIIGVVLKGGAFLASSTLQQRNKTANEKATELVTEKIAFRDLNEVTIAFVKQDLNHLKKVLEKIRTEGHLDQFLKIFSEQSIMFLKNYDGLYRDYRLANKDRISVSNKVVAAFLSLYANNQISKGQFFEKFQQLNILGYMQRNDKGGHSIWIDDNIQKDISIQVAADKIFKELGS